MYVCVNVIAVMQAGFAFLEAGSVRSKNTTSILFKNFMNTICGCVAYWAFGYAFAFGDGNGFIGTRNFFLSEIGLDDSGILVAFFVLYVYAITAATIVSGAMAERTQLKSYYVVTFVLTGTVQIHIWMLYRVHKHTHKHTHTHTQRCHCVVIIYTV